MDCLLTLADNLVLDLAEAFPELPYADDLVSPTFWPVTVEWSDDAYLELSDPDLRHPRIWVLDAADEVATRQGMCVEDYKLLIIVQQKIPARCDSRAFVRALAALTARIRNYCKSRDTSHVLAAVPASSGAPSPCRHTRTITRTEPVDGAVCVEAVRNVARNHDEWHQRRRFFGEILTTWRRA